jgi:rod shape-determining protein MreC
MSRSEGNNRRLFVVFGALLLLNLGLMTWTAKRFSPEDGSEQTLLRSWTTAALAPIQSVFGGAISSVGSVWSSYVDLRGARERAEKLEVENATLRQESETARSQAAEVERLRQLVGLKDRTKYEFVVAEVVARDATQWFKHVTIDKGSASGIALNMPVVTPGGLVGRVVHVTPVSAEIQLITDEHAGAGGRLVNSRVAGEIKGRGEEFCRMKSISSIQTVTKDEAIVTSGLDRVYPAGILIGYVLSAEGGGGAIPQDIVVRPAAPLDRLEEVMVLKIDKQHPAVPEAAK